MEQLIQAIPAIEQLSKIGIGVVSTLILILGAVWYLYQLKPLIENNTKAIELMSQSLTLLGEVVNKTSDKIIQHDERSVHMQSDILDLCEQVNCLQRDVSEIKGQLRK